MLTLRELQLKFFQAIASPPPAASKYGFDPDFVQLVQGRGPLGAEERIDIYAQMYCARILDALSEDFLRVAAALGPEHFRAVARVYLAGTPSVHPSLRYIGRSFPTFLSTHRDGKMFPFLPDLARLEWARLEVFDACDAVPLQMTDLQAIPPEEWPQLKFCLIPACQILTSAWPIHDIWSILGDEMAVDWTLAQPVETAVRVWRDNFIVYQASMDPIEQHALQCVQAGEAFATICETVESLVPPEHAAQEVGALLIRWVEDGILQRQ